MLNTAQQARFGGRIFFNSPSVRIAGIMLQQLRIRNFAIIQTLDVSFEEGLTTLSGETGAGKSIVVGALGLLLGGRASAEMIRTGSEEATVEAVFDVVGNSDLVRDAADAGLDISEESLILRRVISRSGRNKIYIGNSAATLQQLAFIGGRLLDISGQYSQQMLLQVENHGSILDAFAAHQSLLHDYEAAYTAFQQGVRELRDLQAGEARSREQQDLLQFQYAEIEQARVQPGEDEALEHERTVLQNARSLYERAWGTYQQLYEDEQSCLGALQRMARDIAQAADIDPQLRAPCDQLQQAAAVMEDAAFDLRAYAERIVVDPQRLEDVENRLELLQRLKRKYGGTLESVLERFDECSRALANISGGSVRIEELQASLMLQCDGLWNKAAELSKRRRSAAETLQKKIARELSSIGMPRAVFICGIDTAARPEDGEPEARAAGLGSSGCDSVEFSIVTNQGEDPKPLSKIASGGELSRIVLALKKILARNYSVPTLLFDEVDAGIGGAVAHAVGLKLKEIAQDHQVLCITHLPQIACFGNHHFSVSKTTCDGRTSTQVAQLDKQERLEEIARMLGGRHITEATFAHARDMLAQAAEQ
jgi:DNA repair protein RecN (Recombination protein N)